MKKKLNLVTVVDRVIREFVKMGEDRWIKGAAANDVAGCPVSPLNKNACSFCNIGVLQKVLGSTKKIKAENAIDDAFRHVTPANYGMVSFNDDSHTTFGMNLAKWVEVRHWLKDRG